MSTTDLTWSQKFGLKLRFWAIPAYVVPRATLRFIHSSVFNTQRPVYKDLIRNRVIRWLGNVLDFAELRATTTEPKSVEDILLESEALVKMGAECSLVQEDGFQGFWLPKSPGARYTLFYVHGGGFTTGSSSANARYLLRMFLELQDRGVQCDILSVEYDLSPEAQYPTALQQISCAYKYAADLGKPIIVVGDSAGGNLCLALLQHLKIPHPHIKPIIDRPFPIALVLVSPWLNLRNDGISVIENAPYDCLDKDTLDRWAEAYLGPHPSHDTYANPSGIDKGWTSILPLRTLIVAGGLEMFLTDITDLVQKATKEGYGGLDLHIEPLKAHAWPAVDFALGVEDPLKLQINADDVTNNDMKGLRLQVNWIVSQLQTPGILADDR